MAEGNDDCWDAFGSDDDEESDENIGGGGTTKEDSALGLAVAQHLSLFFLQQNSQIHLPQRRVGILASPKKGDDDNDNDNDNDNDADDSTKAILSTLEQRGIAVELTRDTAVDDDSPLDALVVLMDKTTGDREKIEDMNLLHRLIPGGILVTNNNELFSDCKNYHESTTKIYDIDDGKGSIIGKVKKTIHAHSNICPWLPSSHSIPREEDRLHMATITLSSHEIKTSNISEISIQRAVQCMNNYGYCIIPKLLPPQQCKNWGNTVLQSVHSAATILLERDQVDIYHPHTSKFEPQAYRELSMREDLRLDLRFGPELDKLRSEQEDAATDDNNNDDEEELNLGNKPLIIKSSHTNNNNNGGGSFLRGHGSILEIVCKTMNPKRDDLYKGNIGRYNFDGTGADGSYQDLRTSPVGGIVSFPGAAEQAIHADTPHLFEHIPDLPAHYINIFTPGTDFNEKVGGTAFVHGSHNLEFTAKYYGSDDDEEGGSNNNDNTKIYPYLVRPCLSLGDVVLFDCRVLHFGLANVSDSIERVMLYTNTTQAWFHDPKNWDDKKPIFEK